MIRLLVKLVVAGLVANAIYRVGSEYFTFIRFRDGIRAEATYRAKTDDELRRRIVALAAEFDIPLGRDDVAIVRDNRLVTVNAGYRKPIEVVPNYSVEWPFDVSLQVALSAADRLPGAQAPP